MFDPTIGRWFEEDPIGFAAGDPNLFRYVGNGPTNASDPSGLDALPAMVSGPSAAAVPGVYTALAEKTTIASFQLSGRSSTLITDRPNEHVLTYPKRTSIALSLAKISLPCQPGNADNIKIRVLSSESKGFFATVASGLFPQRPPILSYGWPNGIVNQKNNINANEKNINVNKNKDGSMTIELRNVQPDAELPNVINKYQFNMVFEISFQGGLPGTWKAIPSSDIRPFTIYATLEKPEMGGKTLLQDVLNAGCLAAAGENPSWTMDVVDALFAAFSSKRFTTTAGKPVRYYKENKFTMPATGVPDLLSKCDGQCGDWANLFVRVLRAQGLAPNGENGIWAYTAPAGEWFLVKGQWQFNKNAKPGQLPKAISVKNHSYEFADPRDPMRASWGTVEENLGGAFMTVPTQFEFKGTFDPMIIPKVPDKDSDVLIGQNSKNPVSSFDNHVIVFWGPGFGGGGNDSKIYDPSYGNVFPSAKAFVEGSIFAFVTPATVRLSEIKQLKKGDGDPLLPVWLFRKPSDADSGPERWKKLDEK